MKKNRIFNFCAFLAGFGLLLGTNSCKDDPKPPKAEFSFEQSAENALEVAFFNESKDATSYSWDFGDGKTSAEENPTHVYDDYGTFTVTLTAKGEGGSNEVSYDVELIDPGIVIDGKFDDWADIQAIASYPDGEGRTLLELKVDNNETFIHFYIKGTANLGEVIQIFIDADNVGTTGWDYWNFFEAPGIEYLMEAVIVAFEGAEPGSGLQTATGPDAGWPWQPFVASNAIHANSGYVASGSNKIVELSMLREMFTNPVLSGTIRIVVGNSDNTWANVGHLPPSATDPLTPPAIYVMK
ncbi:MAG: PKD domain-containing protein [Bacteroidales bacterium]|nr:PKD domain-containing protein [Bacteroidales bacterium]